MILGKNLILTVGDESRGLAASKSCDLSIDTDFIEVCSPVNGSWKEYLPTINSWSASIDTLVATLSDHKILMIKQKNKEMLMCCFFDAKLEEFYKGNCYISGLRIKGTTGSLATMSVNIKPTGELKYAEEQEIDMHHATIITGKYLYFINESVINVSNGSGSDMISAYELEIKNDTRITIPSQMAIINSSLTNVQGWINANDTSSLNANLIITNARDYRKSAIIRKKNSPFVITIIARHMSDMQSVTYLSKF